jgi:CRP/FNR family cyclic AMP-dependent transcriptional regulator
VIRTASKGSPLSPDSEIAQARIEKSSMGFDPADFLSDAGAGKTIIHLKREESVFLEGDPADTVFYIKEGQVKLAAVSKNGKKATIAQLGAGDFIGEECLETDHVTRIATALTDCTLLRIDRKEMTRVLHEEPTVSLQFVFYLLARGAQLEADLAE